MNKTNVTVEGNNNIEKRLNVNPELLFFKNEVLRDLKQLETKILNKIDLQKDDMQDKLNQYQTKIDSLTQKIFALSNYKSENINLKEKLDSLFEFKTKMEETMTNYDLRLSITSKELVDAINKYDKLFDSNIFYPGIVGSSNAKFNNLRGFIDYTMNNIGQLINFKDNVIGIDFNKYKKNLDKMIEILKKQTQNIIENNKIFTISYVDDLNNKIQSEFKLYTQKLFDLKISNTTEFNNLAGLANTLAKDLNKIDEFKREIIYILNKNIDNLNHNYNIADIKLNECFKDYNEIRKSLDILYEFMNSLKAGVKGSLNSNITFQEFINNKKKKSRIA